jgi:tRNA(Ile)-lysidine synthase
MNLAQRMLDGMVTACGVDHPKQQHFLLAVSGGRDSVVMAHLFAELELSFGICHCNFQLRGKAAEEDAQFVKALAAQLHCSFHLAVFDAQKIAEQDSVSVQMAARKLRYEWFESLQNAEGYDYIATAHHLTDAIETQLHHLARGTGIKGLLGIPSSNGRVIRPLLLAGSGELAGYQEAHGLTFREDSSNAETKYTRNFIRHHILPPFRELNPRLEVTFGENMQRLKESAWLMDQMLDQIEAEAREVDGDKVVYKLEGLVAYTPALSTVLFELLSPYGLNPTQAGDLAESIQQGYAGRLFLTATHEIATSASTIEIVPAIKPPLKSVEIPEGEERVDFPGGQLRLQLLEGQPDTFSPDSNVAYFDADFLPFPLQLRNWQTGDQFEPFGMDGHHQKLQDYFSNNKFSRAEKAATWLLVDAEGQVAWVTGNRSSHRHRIRKTTSKYWVAEIHVD